MIIILAEKISELSDAKSIILITFWREYFGNVIPSYTSDQSRFWTTYLSAAKPFLFTQIST